MPWTTSTALLSFSHDQHHETGAAKQKGGGTNEHCAILTTGTAKRIHFPTAWKNGNNLDNDNYSVTCE